MTGGLATAAAVESSTGRRRRRQFRTLIGLVKAGDRAAAGAVLDRLLQRMAAAAGSVERPMETEDDAGDGTVLIRTAGRGYEEMVSRLLVAGADVNARASSNGSTALHVAAERGWTGIVRQLIEFGADVNALTLLGETPCHLAAYYGHIDAVRLLVDAGADLAVKNWRGNDVLQEAGTAGPSGSNMAALTAVIVDGRRATRVGSFSPSAEHREMIGCEAHEDSKRH